MNHCPLYQICDKLLSSPEKGCVGKETGGVDTVINLVTIYFVMNDAVAFHRALADPTRWRIVRLVATDALCVCELADILGMPHSSVSSHVQVIRKAGLLEDEKCEKWTYFRIAAKYCKLIRTLEAFFAGSGDAAWDGDAYRAARRLEERAGSCCPGPKKLKSRKTFLHSSIS